MHQANQRDDSGPYFAKYEYRQPPETRALSPNQESAWQLVAAFALFLGCTYLFWRWTQSFNVEAAIFSATVLVAETLAFVGLILFYFDIWSERDTPMQAPPSNKTDVGLTPAGALSVDIFITTFDEPVSVVGPSIAAAHNVQIPSSVKAAIHVLDDGARADIQTLCNQAGANYITRPDNRGYKAGNLREAILATNGDFIVICDADTRLFPSIIENTLGYFRDPAVSWVQTPHWFYDLPEGHNNNRYWLQRAPRAARWIACQRKICGGSNVNGADPFMNTPDLFFDVIQRRRNRNHASFCCGAGSIHRREALLDVALRDQADQVARVQKKLHLADDVRPTALLRPTEAQPFEMHVSEDIFTSIRHHRRGWKSVYHPQVEAKMLSPRTISSWSLQRMKYAGGTFDIMRRANPVFVRDMPWRTRLHYASTFWSYLSVLWLPVLLFSPALSLLTGWSPVKAYSLEFFRHLLPFLIAHEFAVSIASKGHDINLGRAMNIGLLPMHLKAGWNIIRGRKPNFVPTPKIPLADNDTHLLIPHFATLVLFAIAATVGMGHLFASTDGYGTAFVATNMFWLLWNTATVWRTARILFWREHPRHAEFTTKRSHNRKATSAHA